MKKVYLVRNERNEPDVVPDDFFEMFGVPVRDWLRGGYYLEGSDPSFIASTLSDRCEAYSTAHRLYTEAAKEIYDSTDPLRHEPWVIPEYQSEGPAFHWLFIFKAENNGNTYRCRYIED